MSGKKGMRRTVQRYSSRNPKSVNYYKKLRKRSARTPTLWKTRGPSWNRILKDLIKALSK